MGAVAFAAGGSGAGERTVATVTASRRPKAGGASGPKGEGSEDDEAVEVDEYEVEDEADAWPPVFEEGDENGPISVPFFRLDADSEIEGDTALLREARSKQTAGDSRKASATEAATRRAMGRLDEPPAAVMSKAGSAACCLPSFLPAAGESGRRIVLLQLPGRLPIAPQPQDATASSSSSSSSSASGAGGREPRTGPPSTSGAASTAHKAATDPELTPAQRGALRVKAAAEYNEFVTDPEGAAAALRGLGGGRIGEMRVRRSGRCELVIGDAVFELARGVTLRQVQEVVKLDGAPTPDWRLPGADMGIAARLRPVAEDDDDAEEDGAEGADDPSTRRGRLLQLGCITDKLVATPVVDDMLRQWAAAEEDDDASSDDDHHDVKPEAGEAAAAAESSDSE